MKVRPQPRSANIAERWGRAGGSGAGEYCPTSGVRADDGGVARREKSAPRRDQRVTLSHEAYIPHRGIASEARQKRPLTRAFLWR